MLEAITRAGYLMEQRVVLVVEKFGFKVTPNQRFHEPASDERLSKELMKQKIETQISKLMAAEGRAEHSDGN